MHELVEIPTFVAPPQFLFKKTCFSKTLIGEFLFWASLVLSTCGRRDRNYTAFFGPIDMFAVAAVAHMMKPHRVVGIHGFHLRFGTHQVAEAWAKNLA